MDLLRISRFQSTPPRGRRLGYPDSLINRYPVSIHASAREATMFKAQLRILRKVSIHASAREATPDYYCNQHGRNVSIHASAREATKTRVSGVCHYVPFQSTPPRGRRPAGCAPTTCPEEFQSTPPRGRRQVSAATSSPAACFNPRLRAGGDAADDQYYKAKAVSIHASAREATSGLRGTGACRGFQSTPPRGRRRPGRRGLGEDWMFQSTPPRGRRPNTMAADHTEIQVSIHASAREATCQMFKIAYI